MAPAWAKDANGTPVQTHYELDGSTLKQVVETDTDTSFLLRTEPPSPREADRGDPEAGAGTRLMSDGDVAGGINAARHDARVDMCIGVGGSPEGIVTACAIKALGGHIQGRIWPRDDEERQAGIDAGLKMDYAYDAEELVRGNNTIFVATGVTDGQLVASVNRTGEHVYTESIVLRSHSGTLRRVTSDHLVSKWF